MARTEAWWSLERSWMESGFAGIALIALKSLRIRTTLQRLILDKELKRGPFCMLEDTPTRETLYKASDNSLTVSVKCASWQISHINSDHTSGLQYPRNITIAPTTISMKAPLQRAKVIAGFPGIGKSYITSRPPSNYTVLDLDTSAFSHHSTGQPNSAFPHNYIEAILPHLNTPNLILLVGVHDVVRDELVKHGIDFTLVYPDQGLKDEYMKRWRSRGSPDGFLRKMDGSWVSFIQSCQGQTRCRRVVLRKGQFLGDVLGVVVRS